MRVLIFHGYLLGGTGSNVYNARLAEALVRLGHEVHLFCQDRHPERQPFVGAVGDWDSGELQVSVLPRSRSQGSPLCTAYRPNIGGLLPVYVQDRYEGIHAKTFAQCTEAEVAAYIKANVDAVREVAERVRPEVALANHLVMGPVIIARALGSLTPYAVKVHGSALEYTVKPEPERFLPFAREGLAHARTVLVGSKHTAVSLWGALGAGALERRTRLGPPGVDVERFAALDQRQAEVSIRALIERLRHGAPAPTYERASAFARDELAAADALERLVGCTPSGAHPAERTPQSAPGGAHPAERTPQDTPRGKQAGGESGPLVAFVGKLIVSKGVDLLIAAWPLVLRSVPDARLAIIGFGAYREGLERLIARLADGDLEGACEIARVGRALEAREGALAGARTAIDAAPLRHLLAFLDSLLDTEAEDYRVAARAIEQRIVFTGRLDHDELAEVLPACEALVVPSTFPEAFGMVAVEAAACGVLPVSAGHSGLAEVSEAIAREIPEQVTAWLSFPVDDNAVRAIAERVVNWLGADRALKEQTRAALVSVARERWSWEGVARGVIAAARGEPDKLESEPDALLDEAHTPRHSRRV